MGKCGGKAISSKNAKEIGTRQLPFEEENDNNEDFRMEETDEKYTKIKIPRVYWGVKKRLSDIVLVFKRKGVTT